MLKITLHDLIPDPVMEATPWTSRPTSNPQEPVGPIDTDVDLDGLLTMPIDRLVIREYLKERDPRNPGV